MLIPNAAPPAQYVTGAEKQPLDQAPAQQPQGGQLPGQSHPLVQLGGVPVFQTVTWHQGYPVSHHHYA